MPIYIYECTDCLEEFKVSHGMSETATSCEWCESKNIDRKPLFFTNLSKKKKSINKVGDLTKDFINISKDTLDEYKKDLEGER
tara:strand:- start:35958 stop:36206 length:249 start_codon:yes stop_codon:yes gene_type:complete